MAETLTPFRGGGSVRENLNFRHAQLVIRIHVHHEAGFIHFSFDDFADPRQFVPVPPAKRKVHGEARFRPAACDGKVLQERLFNPGNFIEFISENIHQVLLV
ncbi:MAG: hypothetical protein IPP35_12665 [Elusimicrobia bacterium]|nr:hypothetical protein [Elusimicrobiota bacterium]